MSFKEISRYQVNSKALEFQTQMDKRHHVAYIPSSADAVAMFELVDCLSLQDIVKICLFIHDKEISRCNVEKVLSVNKPEFQSYWLPLMDWDFALTLHTHQNLRIVMETRQRWDQPAKLHAKFLFIENNNDSTPLPFVVVAPRLYGPKARKPSMKPWKPKALPQKEQQQQHGEEEEEPSNTCELASSEFTVDIVGDGLMINCKWDILLERIQIVDERQFPVYFLLLDGRRSKQFSQGGVFAVDNLAALAGTLEIPYSGNNSLAQNATVALKELSSEQLNRCLDAKAVDGQGVQLRFKERVPTEQRQGVKIKIWFWKKQKKQREEQKNIPDNASKE